MRKRRGCHALQVISVTNTGTQLVINVATQPLTSGEFYRVDLDNIAFPVGISGAEQAVIVMGGTTIVLGDYRARIVRAERIHRHALLCMVYTQDSIAAGPAGAAVVPAFIVECGLHTLP